MEAQLVRALQDARRAEKQQALFYRALAAAAEAAGHADAAENLNGLHADEQHHLSRITVKLVEANAELDELSAAVTPPVTYPHWQDHARAREEAEISRYETLLALRPDEATATLLTEILAAERKHAERLGGKYMSA